MRDYLFSGADKFSEISREDFRNFNLSVVVPVYNEELVIERFLKILEKQEDKGFNVVLTDNGSEDKSMEIIENFFGKSSFGLSLVKQEIPGAAEARKMGADWVLRQLLETDNISRKHYLVVCDADVLPPESWIKTIKNRFKQTGVGILSGTHGARKEVDESILTKTGIKKYFNVIPEIIEYFQKKEMGNVKLSGPNAAFESMAYVLGGGIKQEFNEDGEVFLHEVNRLAKRSVKSGCVIEPMNCRVISSKRRQLYEILEGMDSYLKNAKQGRFGIVRDSEDYLLKKVLDEVSVDKLRGYRHKKMKTVLSNILGGVDEQTEKYLLDNFRDINISVLYKVIFKLDD